MAEKNKKKIQTYLLSFVLIAVLIAGALMLLPVYRAQQKKQSELMQLRRELADKKAERNARMQEVEELKNSPAAVEKVAREKFRYAREGETILEYPAPPRPAPGNAEKQDKTL